MSCFPYFERWETHRHTKRKRFISKHFLQDILNWNFPATGSCDRPPVAWPGGLPCPASCMIYCILGYDGNRISFKHWLNIWIITICYFLCQFLVSEFLAKTLTKCVLFPCSRLTHYPNKDHYRIYSIYTQLALCYVNSLSISLHYIFLFKKSTNYIRSRKFMPCFILHWKGSIILEFSTDLFYSFTHT